MPRPRYTRRSYYDTPTVPFINAEEAWFWFVRCQRARDDGVRFDEIQGSLGRPCDPDDLYRAVLRLAKHRRIDNQHLKVLETYGLCERPPDPRCRDEERPARLWDEALDRLTTVLRPKGIIQ